MAGFDLPMKLRRSLGGGRICPEDHLIERLARYDGDNDGRLTPDELSRCLEDAGLGGSWYCGMLAKTMFKTTRVGLDDAPSLRITALARVLHHGMSRVERPVRRYVISPEVMSGNAPRVGLDKKPVDAPSPDAKSALRPAAPRPEGPRGPAPRPEGPRSPGPGLQQSPSGPAPRATAPRAPPRGPSRPDPGRGPARPVARGAPRRPSGRPRS